MCGVQRPGGLCPYTAWERGREEKGEGAGRQTLIMGRAGGTAAGSWEGGGREGDCSPRTQSD